MERPLISQIVLDCFANIIDSQDKKRFEKYGKTIDAANNEEYNWELMALEETADLQKYLVCRILEVANELSKEKCKVRELENSIKRLKRDLNEAVQENAYLSDQLKGAKEKIQHLKTLSRVTKCMQLEQDNLVLAQENAKLKEFMNV